MITIVAIPESEMRNPGAGQGDWFWEGDDLHIRVVHQGTINETFLFALHELVEAVLCKEARIPQEAVDAFDNSFVAPADDPDAEPGDDPRAPYGEQHRAACLIEFLMAKFLGIQNYGMMR